MNLNKREMIFLFTGIIIGMIAGYALGFSTAISILIERASRFVNIDSNLVNEYIWRGG